MLKLRGVQVEKQMDRNDTHAGMGVSLTHFTPIFNFCTPWKHQKTRDFITFSGCIKMEHLREMAWEIFFQTIENKKKKQDKNNYSS